MSNRRWRGFVPQDEPEQQPEPRITQAEEPKQRGRGAASETAFFPEYTPQSLPDFAGPDGWSRLLATGSVFLHDKRPNSDRLIDVLAESAGVRVRKDTIQADPQLIVDELTGGRARRRPQALMIDDFSELTEVEAVLRRYRSAFRRRDGLWIKGYVQDFLPRIMRLFDILIFFDMATEALESLRSVVGLTEADAEELKEASDRWDSVIVAVTVEPSSKRSFPILAPNPLRLVLHERKARTAHFPT